MGQTPITIDPQLVADIKMVADKVATKIPIDYVKQRISIVDKMKEKSPEPYKNLRYADYPEKNGSQVNALALQNATAKDVRKKLAAEVNSQIQPKVDEQTAGKDMLTKAAIRKAVEASVEQAVDAAVDAAVKNIDINNIEQK